MDAKTGLATLTASAPELGTASVRVNLVTGEFYKLAPKPAGQPAPRPPTEYQLPSPTGRFVLEYAEKPSRRVIIKDARGSRLGVIDESEVGPFSDVGWSPSGDYFSILTTTSASDDDRSRLYIYSIKQRNYFPVARGTIRQRTWSADGRFLAFIRAIGGKAQRLPSRDRYRRGTLVVLDAEHKFRTILSVGKLAADIKFSPGGGRVAFTELVKDEYGDFANTSLRVADIGSSGVRRLVTERRPPVFVWAGDGTLAVVTYDKYAVPTLNLVNLADGSWTHLATDRSFAHFEPLACIPARRIVAYKAATTACGEGPEELWAAAPGKRPIRLFPKRMARSP